MKINISRIFGMFDKLDDIIFVPVNLICDVLRQPLRERNAKHDRSMLELQHHINSMQAELDMVKKNKEEQIRENQIAFDIEMHSRQDEQDVNMRRFNLELTELISQNELKYQAQSIEALKKYQHDLGEASVILADSIGQMSIALMDHAHRLAEERTKAYLNLQNEAYESAVCRLADLEARFPDGSRAREILENSVEKQLIGIIDNADQFIKTMSNDITSLSNNINQITSQAMDNIDRYLAPTISKAVSSSAKQIIDIN